VARKEHRQRPVGVERDDFLDDPIQPDVVPIKAVQGLEAGGPAGRVVRLRKDPDVGVL
jgi:hypothetical protein